MVKRASAAALVIVLAVAAWLLIAGPDPATQARATFQQRQSDYESVASAVISVASGAGEPTGYAVSDRDGAILNVRIPSAVSSLSEDGVVAAERHSDGYWVEFRMVSGLLGQETLVLYRTPSSGPESDLEASFDEVSKLSPDWYLVSNN